MMQRYPGDAHVDWWSVNVLSDGSPLTGACDIERFLTAASSRNDSHGRNLNFSVILAQTMNRGVETTQRDFWARNMVFSILI